MIIPMSNLYGTIRQYHNDGRRSVSGLFKRITSGFFGKVCSWGLHAGMPETERKKLIIFNRLNLFQLFIGLIITLSCLVDRHSFSFATYVSLLLPVSISVLVLLLNKTHRNEAAFFCYFLLYPVITSNIYLRSIDFGFELYFILFGILSIFFIQETGKMIFSIALSMTSYFVLAVLWKDYAIKIEALHPAIYLFTQVFAILLIFYALFLIKNEQSRYQFKILAKNHVLQHKNEQIQQQHMEIEAKAAELEESNAVKNKLFSVISHDLRSPIYAMRNVFQHVNEYDLSAKEIKGLMPDVLHDLNYVTELMENLLQWAKSQMGGHKAYPAAMDITEVSSKIAGQLRNQALSKQIIIDDQLPAGICAVGDKEMISIVLRNLVSNAIKFSPLNGRITIGMRELSTHVEIFVKDNGVGISKDALRKIKACTFYSSKGTAAEGGTGLGLMLSREFIMKNGGQLNIRSTLGKGSEFSFTLPKLGDVTKAV